MSSIGVRVLAYCAEDPRFETYFEPKVADGRSLSTQQRMKTWWKQWGRQRRREEEPATLPNKADGPRQLSPLTPCMDRTWDLPLLLPN